LLRRAFQPEGVLESLHDLPHGVDQPVRTIRIVGQRFAQAAEEFRPAICDSRRERPRKEILLHASRIDTPDDHAVDVAQQVSIVRRQSIADGHALRANARHGVDHASGRGNLIVDQDLHAVESVMLERQLDPLPQWNALGGAIGVDDVAAQPGADQKPAGEIHAEAGAAVDQVAAQRVEPHFGFHPDAAEAAPGATIGAFDRNAVLRPGEPKPHAIRSQGEARGRRRVAMPRRAVNRE